jgi:hypothetical protein
MLIEQLLPVAVLLGLLMVAVASDLRRHRIPNYLVVLGLCLGLASQAQASGLEGLADGALGMSIGFGLFLPLYAAGGMAAGDVKLMAMVVRAIGRALQPGRGRFLWRAAGAAEAAGPANPGPLLADAAYAGLPGPGGGRGGR